MAIVSDTHVNEKEDFSASPYPANAEANPRARHVFSQVNRIAPALTIHLGDMVNPVPELPSYAAAADNFHAIAKDLESPIHLVPGNHDIGDKPVKWMPAGMVNADFIALYRKHFGKDYYAVTHGNCHFVIINSPLLNSGDPAEAEQAAWLEDTLARHQRIRHIGQHALDQLCAFVSAEAHLAEHRFAQVHPRQCLAGHVRSPVGFGSGWGRGYSESISGAWKVLFIHQFQLKRAEEARDFLPAW